jgi:hypothetical protein
MEAPGAVNVADLLTGSIGLAFMVVEGMRYLPSASETAGIARDGDLSQPCSLLAARFLMT